MYAVDYGSALKRKAALTCAPVWMKQETVFLSEKSEIQKESRDEDGFPS
jgi:hypothetical protein